MKKEVKKNKKTSKMTIDKLAIMVASGFESIHSEMATKEELKNLELKMATKADIQELKDKLEKTDKRIDDFSETKASKISLKDLNKRVTLIEEKL